MKNKLLLILFGCFMAVLCKAQNGLATWYEIEISKKIIEGLSFEVKPELRLNPDFGRDEYFFETGLEYKVLKGLKVAGYYRYYNENKKKNDEIGHRYFFDVKPEVELGKFELQGRLRYVNYFLSKDVSKTDPYLRYRVKAKYAIKSSNLEPFASIEFFHDLTGNEFNKVRYTGGVKYDFNKTHAVDFFYRLQDNWLKGELLHIVGFGYSLKI